MSNSRRLFGVVAASMLCGAVALSANAAPIVVDGNLADWNVTIGDNNTSNFATVAVTGLKKKMIEDSDDNAGLGGFVGPYNGGQAYDAEFMAVAVQGNRLYIAIVSGIRPDNGFANFGPGDIRIETSGGHIFGIEVGGGAGHNGAAQAMISEGAAGTTYQLNGSGVTTGIGATDAAQTAGSIWKDATWINDPIADATNYKVQFSKGLGTKVGTSTYRYTLDSLTTQHSVIEVSLDLADLGHPTFLSIFFHPTCGNDILELSNVDTTVPTPATLPLLGAGLALLALARRRVARAG